MTTPTRVGLHTLRQVAAALGVPLRTVRSWAETGVIDTLQPVRNMRRMVSADEVQRLERLGYRVNWRHLEEPDDTAEPADSADSDQDAPERLP